MGNLILKQLVKTSGFTGTSINILHENEKVFNGVILTVPKELLHRKVVHWTIPERDTLNVYLGAEDV